MLGQCFNMVTRRNKNTLLLSIVAVIGIYIIYSSDLMNFNQSIEVLTEDYCNTPHDVSGDEMEKIPGFHLKQVQILIRHGDRAPVDPEALPNTDPVKMSCLFNLSNMEYTKNLQHYIKVIERSSFSVKGSEDTKLLEERNLCQPGQLTPYGILQHFYLGAHLRASYKEFVEGIDILNGVHILATDVPRTKQSSAALLTGMLYDKLMENKFSSQIPINVHIDHVPDTHILLDEKENPLRCPMVKTRSMEFKTSESYKSFVQDTHQMYQTLASSLSVDVKNLPMFNRIVDIFYTRTCHKLGIPHGPEKSIPDSLVKVSLDFSHRYHYIKHSPPLGDLQALSLFSQIAKHALLVLRDEKEQKKLVVYSGHDSMIHPFLQVIDSAFTEWPPYASRIVFEIYLTDGVTSDDPDIINRAYFRIIYNGKPVKKINFCHTLEGPHMLCPLAEFYRFVSNGFVNFSKYDTEVLSDFLFAKIKDLCKDEK